MDTFDLCGDLPSGTTLLEASAGTGKTYTVAALVTRFVAEGHATLDEMLVITFGRAASQELRDRVRGQLVEAERAFADPGTSHPDGSFLAFLLEVDEEERLRRWRRLRDALASFDAATIATTHQFCQLVLRSLGVAGDTDAGATLVESVEDLVGEVVDDVYLRRYGNAVDPPPFDRPAALELALAAVRNPQAVLADEELTPGSTAAERVSFAGEVRGEVERRKRRDGVLSYDDLLSRLAAALAPTDAPARDRMRSRWRFVLVDEFQDTDPVQWEVLHRAFHGHATLILIGDPKQAIYAFRGGDVFTYLDAVESATTRATLGTNWRSDEALLSRLQVLLHGAELGDPGIVVPPVQASHPGSRLAGAPHPAPFRLRRVPRDVLPVGKQRLISVGRARPWIADDCAADIAELLASGATWAGAPVRASDVAVLVASGAQGLLVQQALRAVGVPAVVAGGGQLFGTPAAADWLALLEAIEQPHRSGRVRAAAVTAFFAETATSLDAGGDALTDRIATTLRAWGALVRGPGVAALFEAAEEQQLSARVLARSDGERLLTDLRHIAQVLHDVTVRERLGLTALLQWFREERARPTGQERTRRLDSDAAAVQVVTIHASKGLEYPVVYLPFVHERYLHPVSAALFHDEDRRRIMDVSQAGDRWQAHHDRHRAEDAGEDLRELYVALTRAQSQVVTWWAPTTNTENGSLHRMVFGRTPGSGPVPDAWPVRDDDYVADVLERLAGMGGPSAEVAAIADTTPLAPPAAPTGLEVRSFTRRVDTAWTRTSYSGLIRAEEPVAVGSEPEVPTLDDEGPHDDVTASTATPAGAGGLEPGTEVVSPMADLPAGAAFGSLVHAVLEHADPEAPDFPTELVRRVEEHLPWWPVAVAPEQLAAALLPLHETPLGPMVPGLTLRDIALRDRLRELDFEFPLAGGDLRVRHREVHLSDLAPLLREHLPADDPLRPYADRLQGPALGGQLLRGYLSGSVDVVLRVPGSTGPGSSRYLVVDYKTNLLGPGGRPLCAADYAREQLTAAMLHSHYPLQAMLYSVVVHRYLRWRLPGYQPEAHLGGVLYLYLRGMCGPETPLVDGHPAGVFSWRPPASLVEAMSDLLAGLAPVTGVSA